MKEAQNDRRENYPVQGKIEANNSLEGDKFQSYNVGDLDDNTAWQVDWERFKKEHPGAYPTITILFPDKLDIRAIGRIELKLGIWREAENNSNPYEENMRPKKIKINIYDSDNAKAIRSLELEFEDEKKVWVIDDRNLRKIWDEETLFPISMKKIEFVIKDVYTEDRSNGKKCKYPEFGISEIQLYEL